MTVICNATPLINFAAINRLDILKDVFGEVLIPLKPKSRDNAQITVV